MKKIWLTTDTHLGHDNMVEYCSRPQNHSELILKNLWIISGGDTLIHLGDVCIGHDTDWHKELMSVLDYRTEPIKRILIRGNHDRKSDNWYLEHGWDFVCDSFTNEYLSKKITFSHYPIPHIDHLNIHGHFHNNLPRLLRKEWVVPDEEERNKKELEGLNDNHKLLALEYTNYKPVLLSSFTTPNKKVGKIERLTSKK